jgi:hypothetical protein
MKAIRFVLLAACAAAVAAPAQEASSRSNAELEVRAMERARFDAEGRGDRSALDALFDDLLLLVDYEGGLLNKTGYLAKFRGPGEGLREVATETMSVRVYEDSAIVTGVYREKGLKNGESYLQRRRFIDTWVYKKGKWVCVAAAATPLPR